ncbi:MAG TPA: hypothetical protein VEB86_00080 [Chryseosolibacter sp.]|nr:hypothetical protein [Chryseosolibacter sp.]
MQTFLKWMLLVAVFVSFVQCDEPDANPSGITEIHDFLNSAKQDPIVIDGTVLGDSWRVTRYEYAYWDGEFRKEGDEDLLNPTECPNYQEFWIFDRDKVMLAFKGDCFDKDWDGYYEKFNQSFDAEKNILKIDYVYDGGEKQYTVEWTVTKISQTELELTEQGDVPEDFVRYTFRREKF